MPLIALIGTHAIGKTTAVRRWIERYPKLIGIIADTQLAIRDGEEAREREREREWKGTGEDKRTMIEQYRSLPRITVIDTAAARANMILPFFSIKESVICLQCSPIVMLNNLRSRCEKQRKKFNSDYWDIQRLTYEAQGRAVNYVQKNLHPSQYRIFTVNDYERDWPVVDEYFGSLYRRFNNELNRKKVVT